MGPPAFVVLSVAKDLIAACNWYEILRCAQDDTERGPRSALDHPLGAQLLDGRGLVAQLLQDRLGMLAEPGRAAAYAEWRARQLDGLLQHRGGLGHARIIHVMEELRGR